MYVYDEYDQKIVDERVAQYRDQTERFLAGKLSEEQFLPLRLQNGLYIQRYAPMLRIAIPCGMLASYQLRKLGEIAARHPILFGESAADRDYDAVGGKYVAGEHVDAWGCVWSNIKTGRDSIVTGHPVPTREDVRRLRHRASLALWCGNNEVSACLEGRGGDDPASEGGDVVLVRPGDLLDRDHPLRRADLIRDQYDSR